MQCVSCTSARNILLVLVVYFTVPVVKCAMPIHTKSKNVCGFCFSVQKNLRKKCVNSHDKISRQKCVNHRISIFSFTKKGIHLLTALCQAYTIIYCVFPTILKWNVRSETRNLSCKTCQLTLVFEYAC